MPNDEAKKKKWRVNTWEQASEAEAQRIENALNGLADDKYEIYEVDFKKGIVVGRLEEEDDDEIPPLFTQEPTPDGPPPMPDSFVTVLQDIFARRRARPEAAQVAEAPPEPQPEAPPEGVFIPSGKLSTRFFGCLNDFISAKMEGDPYTEKRVDSLIKHMFKGAPLDEVQKSLADVERFHSEHLALRAKEGQDCDTGCALHAVFALTEKKLKAHLAANPAN
jgi:hypothetical protein